MRSTIQNLLAKYLEECSEKLSREQVLFVRIVLSEFIEQPEVTAAFDEQETTRALLEKQNEQLRADLRESGFRRTEITIKYGEASLLVRSLRNAMAAHINSNESLNAEVVKLRHELESKKS